MKTMWKVILEVAVMAVILAGMTNAKAGECEGSASYDAIDFDISWLPLENQKSIARIGKIRKGRALFNKKIIEATRKKVGEYEVYITSIANFPSPSSVARFAITIEIKNATQIKILDGATALTTTSCSGEGKLATCFTDPRWSVKDSFGNDFKSSSARYSLSEQISPDQCDSTGASYSVNPIKNSSIIVTLPKSVLGTEITLTIPKELINEQFYSN